MSIESFLLGEASVSVFGFVLMVYDVVLLALFVISLAVVVTSLFRGMYEEGSCMVPVWLAAPIILSGASLLLGASGFEFAGEYVFAYRHYGLLAVPMLWLVFVTMPSFFNWRAGSIYTTGSSSYKYENSDPGPVDPCGWGPVRRDGMNAHLSVAELDTRIAERNAARKPTYLLRLERSRRRGASLV